MQQRMSMQSAFLEFVRSNRGKELKSIKNDSSAFEYEFLAFINQNNIDITGFGENQEELLRIARSSGFVFKPKLDKSNILDEEIIEADDSEFVPIKQEEVKEQVNSNTVAKNRFKFAAVSKFQRSSATPSYRETFLNDKAAERMKQNAFSFINITWMGIVLFVIVVVALFFMVKFLMLCMDSFFAKLSILKIIGLCIACFSTYILLKPRKKREIDDNIKGMQGYMMKYGHLENWSFLSKFLVLMVIWFFVFCIRG